VVFSLLVLAIAPAAALGLFFYARDRYNREPLFPLLITFLLGIGALLPALVLSMLLQHLTGWNSRVDNLFHTLLGALFIVGLVEEGCKFAVVRLYSYRRPDFDEPYDGIMYSVAAALGFATVENVLYVLEGGIGTGVLRGLLAVPAHAFYGVLMGYFLGEAKFAPGRLRAALLSAAGFGLAVAAHGVYDFLVFAVDRRPFLLLMLPVFAALSWVIFFTATRRHAERSPFKRPRLAALHRASRREAAGRDEEKD
jgi:RsiW-degrading membrane proteinase PrsW (M82 family)